MSRIFPEATLTVLEGTRFAQSMANVTVPPAAAAAE
jgi:hypothetical protein